MGDISQPSASLWQRPDAKKEKREIVILERLRGSTRELKKINVWRGLGPYRETRQIARQGRKLQSFSSKLERGKKLTIRRSAVFDEASMKGRKRKVYCRAEIELTSSTGPRSIRREGEKEITARHAEGKVWERDNRLQRLPRQQGK